MHNVARIKCSVFLVVRGRNDEKRKATEGALSISLDPSSDVPPIVQAVDQYKKVCETFSLAVDKELLTRLMTPALGSYFECLLLSLLSDDELPVSDKRKHLEMGFAKLETYEKKYGAKSVHDLMHKTIASDAAAAVFSKANV